MDIIAHRGASHDAPENTLAAARLAWAQGADALEGDVRLTRDGRLVVIHDEDTGRVACERRRIGSTSLAELRALDVGAWKGAAFAGERIPTLDEWLATVPPRRRVFVELKDAVESVPELSRTLARTAFAPAQVTIIAFALETMRAAKRALPQCEACWIVERNAMGMTPPAGELIAACREAGLDGLDLEASHRLDRALAAQVRAAGLKLYTWTVDEPALARQLRDAGVDGITTNLPGALRAQLGR